MSDRGSGVPKELEDEKGWFKMLIAGAVAATVIVGFALVLIGKVDATTNMAGAQAVTLFGVVTGLAFGFLYGKKMNK